VSIGLDRAELARSLDDVDRLGNRYHGTPGEVRCRDWLAARFEEVGLERVRLESFRYLAYEHGSAACALLAPERVELPCRAVQYSADAEASGEAVYLGTGTQEDFDRLDRLGVELRGKVVVAHSIAPFMVAPFLEGREIAAFVNIGDTPDGLVGNFTAALYPPPAAPPWPGRPVPYPAVTVEAAAGRALVSALTLGPVEVRVEHRGRYSDRESWNVVGEIPGAESARALVGAHYDSQLEGPGAWDNGTGIASLLEIARVLGESRPRRTIDVVAFGVEEVGLWGSVAYAKAHADQLDDMVGMANLDAVASAYPARHTIWTDESMQDFAVESARIQGWDVEVLFDARLFAFSDNTPFTNVGVPACWIWEFPPIHPYYHSSGDVRRLLDQRKLAETAAVTGQLVHRLANVPDPGLGRARVDRADAAGA
jgi:hypothetical protein